MGMGERLSLIGVCTLLLTANAVGQTAVTTSGGTANTIPVFTGTTTVGNSVITQSNGNIGIGTTNPSDYLQVSGSDINKVGMSLKNSDGSPAAITMLVGGSSGFGIGGWANASVIEAESPNGLVLGSINTPGTGIGGPITFQIARSFAAVISTNGNVGIGATSPGAKLEVNGNIKLTSGSGASITFADGTVQSTAWTGSLCGGDYAESVDVSGERKQYEPGDVLVVDPSHPGNFLKSTVPYSRLVAGIYSTKPGLIGRRQTTTDPKLRAEEVPMAMVGIVPTKVTAENGPIEVGDLMVTSSQPGYAMRGTDGLMKTGTVIGKALGSLSSGTGVIEVLVSLQ